MENKIKLGSLQKINGMVFHDIEGGFGENKKSMLAKEIAVIHGRELKTINQLINNNIKRFKEDIDIIDILNGHSELPLQDLGFSNRDIKISNNIYILSERGYAKLLKLMDDDLAWEKYDELVDGYFSMREKLKESKPTCIEDVLISSLQEMKAMRQEINSVKEETAATREEITGLREAVTLNPNQWRKDTATLINKIANKLGGFQHIEPIRKEAYKLLNATYGVDINRRLLNKKKNMALEGCSKSKIDKVNYLDVIAEDKKLVNGYVNIIGRMAIKYGIKEIS